MTYQETLEYLFLSQPAFHMIGAAAYKPGFDNTNALMEHLGNPHLGFRSVHIAGTNGKGSTSHLIAASLQMAGLKVGLYTSPHLVDFRERIRINGQMINEEEVVRWVEKNKAFLDQVKPSFFESTMAMAFEYFAKEHVDIAVIEVGLGGRLDSTNIITPLLSVITNIGMDHTEFLGDTLAKIASEKAGIIKPHVPAVIGESDPETDPVFAAKAKECGLWGDGPETTNCQIWWADQCGYLRRCRERDITECELHGLYQEKNKQTAYVALRALMQCPELEGRLNHEAIRRGFEKVCTLTGLRGRWEVVRKSHPQVICDTGHNSHGLKYVAEQLKSLHPLIIIFGMVDDKDVDQVLPMLPEHATYYFTQARTHRAIPAEKMQAMWMKHHPSHTDSRIFHSVEEAYQEALRNAKEDSTIFVGGSNYVVGEFLSIKEDGEGKSV